MVRGGGRDRPGTKAVFTRDLRAAHPGIQPKRLREDDARRQVLQGIELRKQWTGPLTTPDQAHEQRVSGDSRERNDPSPDRGGQGWSGVEPTVSPTRDSETEPEPELDLGIARLDEIRRAHEEGRL